MKSFLGSILKNMKVIIAGSRELNDFLLVQEAVHASTFKITEVVSGTARGVDKQGEAWASLHDIPIKRFPANWKQYGRGAGHIRNAEMAEYADALIAVWDGKSPGTKNMIELARKHNLKVFIYEGT